MGILVGGVDQLLTSSFGFLFVLLLDLKVFVYASFAHRGWPVIQRFVPR